MMRDVMPGADIKRGLQSQGAHLADVECPHFWVECKHHKQTNIKAALRQAIADSGGSRIPIAICKDTRKEPTVTLRLKDFLNFVQEWWECQ